MNAARGAGLWAVLAGFACTAPDAAVERGSVTTSATSAAASVSAGSPLATASSAAREHGDAGSAADTGDGIARVLEHGTILSVAPTAGGSGRGGVFTAVLADGALADAPRHDATIAVARTDAPLAHRRPLAFYRLAHAMGMHVVPASVERRIGAGELAGLIDATPGVLSLVRTEMSVQNDGTVAVLLTAPSTAAAGSPWRRSLAMPIDLKSSREVLTWERWASSGVPVEGERPQLARDLVETLVLDYLAGNGARRTCLLLPDVGALLLADNRDAFPPHPDAPSLDGVLRRLRAVARFPRGLRDALTRFDRAAAAAALSPGAFETWLLSPRALVELDERRATLLSLVDAAVAGRDEAATPSL